MEPKGSGEKAEIELEFTLGKVNEKQTIKAPANAEPLEKLFGELGVNPLELLGLMQGGGSRGLGGLLEGITGGSAAKAPRAAASRRRELEEIELPSAGKLEGIHRMPERSRKRLGNPEVRIADGIAA